MNIDLIITLQTVLILCALVVWRLSQNLTFYNLCEVDVNLANASHEKLVNTVLYGSSLFSYSQNRSILVDLLLVWKLLVYMHTVNDQLSPHL